MSEQEKVKALIARVTEGLLLVDEMAAETVLANLRALGEYPDFAQWMAESPKLETDAEFFSPENYGRPYTVVDGILQIPVFGMLLNRFTRQIGNFATGHQYIERAFNAGMEDPNVRGIALVIDSTGGEAAGNFELVDKMFARRGEKPVRAFVADRAHSGAYSIASVAPNVVITRSGSAGSIGVVTMHMSMEKRLEQMGVEVTFVFAGKHKVDGNRFQALSKDAKERIQTRINRIYDVFAETVARNRNMSEDAVRNTKARVYDSEEAVEVGLADRIGALEDEMVAFSADLDRDEDGEETMTQTTQKPAAAATEDTISKTDHEAALVAAKAEAVGAERKRVGDVTAHAAYSGREKLAQTLLSTTELSAEQIVAALEAAPKVEAEKPKPEATAAAATAAAATTEKPKAGAEQFADYMNKDTHPEVGADTDAAAAGKEPDPADMLAASYAAATGQAYDPKKPLN